MIPPMGMIDVPYWEWWLHHNPFVKTGHYYNSCPLCCSDTGCWSGCPQREIQNKMAEIKKLVNDWHNRERSA